MFKVTCTNPICGKSFFFDEDKFPNAKKVQCPHCKTLQPLATKPAAEEPWFTPTPVTPPPPDEPHEKKPPKPTPPPPASEEDFAPKSGRRKEEDFESVSPKKKPEPARTQTAPRPKDPRTDPMGWLVVHDEQTSSETFLLRFGKNALGRKSNDTPPEVNIPIETPDNYMSRYHCDIFIELNPEKTAYQYKLSDGALGKKQPSTNGTFLNGKGRMSPSDIWLLKDGDTIQAGRTKLVLKMPGEAKNAQDAIDQVGPTDYFQTIIQ